MPWLIFLRDAFGEYCWDNYQPRAAFTIDDPLLRPSYGFVSYTELLEQARAHVLRLIESRLSRNKPASLARAS
ncbi:MAG: hypothetical protein ACREQ4_07250 [Candidatus Binataceae bacterium]